MTRRALSSLRQLPLAAIALGIFVAIPATAQDDSEGAGPAAEPKVIPTIRTHIYDRLSEAQVCMDEGDMVCATETLDDVAEVRDLNNYEIAQVWNFRAFLYFEVDDFDGAVTAYETILSLPFEDMPDGLIQQSMRNLATLYLQLERYQDGLDTFLRWMDLPTVTAGAADYYLLSTIHYQMEDYAAGIPAVQQAIQIANDNGEIGEESWHQLLYVFYYQLEQTDNVISTLTFMVENWTKRDWVLALAGQLSDQDREDDTLALYEAAYESGWLTRGTEWVQLANLHLNAGAPYKAAILLKEGLDSGLIESTVQNWRLLAQAWQLAAEYETSLPALDRASSLADDGEIERQLAQSYARLARWNDCVDASRRALDRGGLDRPDYVNMQLGQCLVNERRYEEARTAFQAAARDDRSARDAQRWLAFIQTEIARERANAEALASLQQ